MNRRVLTNGTIYVTGQDRYGCPVFGRKDEAVILQGDKWPIEFAAKMQSKLPAGDPPLVLESLRT